MAAPPPPPFPHDEVGLLAKLQLLRTRPQPPPGTAAVKAVLADRGLGVGKVAYNVRNSNNKNRHQSASKIASQAAQVIMIAHNAGLWPGHVTQAAVNVQVASTTHNTAGSSLEGLLAHLRVDLGRESLTMNDLWLLVCATAERLSRYEADMVRKTMLLGDGGLSILSGSRATGRPTILLPGQLKHEFNWPLAAAFLARGAARLEGLALHAPEAPPGQAHAAAIGAAALGLGGADGGGPATYDDDSDAEVDDGAVVVGPEDGVLADLVRLMGLPAAEGGIGGRAAPMLAAVGGGGGAGAAAAAAVANPHAPVLVPAFGRPAPRLPPPHAFPPGTMPSMTTIMAALACSDWPVIAVPGLGGFLEKLAAGPFAALGLGFGLLRSYSRTLEAWTSAIRGQMLGVENKVRLSAEFEAVVRVREIVCDALRASLRWWDATLAAGHAIPGLAPGLQILQHALDGPLCGQLRAIQVEVGGGAGGAGDLDDNRRDVLRRLDLVIAGGGFPEAPAPLTSAFYFDHLLTAAVALESLMQAGAACTFLAASPEHTETTFSLATVAAALLATPAGCVDSTPPLAEAETWYGERMRLAEAKGLTSAVHQAADFFKFLGREKRAAAGGGGGGGPPRVVVAPIGRVSTVVEHGVIIAAPSDSAATQIGFMRFVYTLAARLCLGEVDVFVREGQAFMGTVFSLPGEPVGAIIASHPLRQLADPAGVDVVAFAHPCRSARSADVARWVDGWAVEWRKKVLFTTINKSLLAKAKAGRLLLAGALGARAPVAASQTLGRSLPAAPDHRAQGFARGGPCKAGLVAVGWFLDPALARLNAGTSSALISYAASSSSASVVGTMSQLTSFDAARQALEATTGDMAAGAAGLNLYNSVHRLASANANWNVTPGNLSAFAPQLARLISAAGSDGGRREPVPVTATSTLAVRQSAKDRVTAYINLRASNLPHLAAPLSDHHPIPGARLVRPEEAPAGVVPGSLCCRRLEPNGYWFWGQVVAANPVMGPGDGCGAGAAPLVVVDWALTIVYGDDACPDDVDIQLSALATVDAAGVWPNFMVADAAGIPLNYNPIQKPQPWFHPRAALAGIL